MDMGNTANLTMDPTYVGEYNHALELGDAGDLHRAIALLENLGARYPTDARVRSQLSSMQIRCGDYRGAFRAAQEALSYDPDYLGGHINAGVAAHGLGDLATSRRHLERAVCIAPYDPDAQLHLGRVLAQLQEIDAAIDAFVRAIGEAHRVPRSSQWLIEQGIAGLAALTSPSPPEESLYSLHEGVRHLATGQLARAYRLLEHARGGPCAPGAVAARTAATVLLDEIWRLRARGTSAPSDREHRAAEVITLQQPQ